MEPHELAALEAQKATQDKQMAAMMQEYGLDPGGGVGGAELADLAKEMGMKPGQGGMSEEDQIMANIAAMEDMDPENMTEDQLLAELGAKSPADEAEELKTQIDDLLAEIKALMGQGKKAEAAGKLRERKAAEAALAELYAKNPGLQAQAPAASV